MAILHMHGKSSNPQAPHYARFIIEMTALGNEVYAPLMPWSARRYQGMVDDGLESIARIIDSIPAERVVVTGQSMGGMAALQYASGKVSSKVIGVVSILSGGHGDVMYRHTDVIDKWIQGL